MNTTKYTFMLMLLSATTLLTGCSGDDDFNGNGNVNGNNSNAITFNTNVSNFISKAKTYDSQTALQEEGSFTCTAYNAGTITAYTGPTRVVWSENNWHYVAGASHDWPGTSALDFFAYMPAEKPSYIGEITYNTARQPQFTVENLPSDQSDTKEFVCALTTDRNKVNSGESGVKMKFYHPFARLKFELNSQSGSNVTINSVTLSGLATSGTCTFNGTNSTNIDEYGVCNFFYHSVNSPSGIMPVWSSQSGSGNLVATAINGTTPYLVIPNTYAAGAITITVNATWTGISSTTVNKTATNKNTLTWEPGYSYLFTLKLSGDILIVDTEKYTEQW